MVTSIEKGVEVSEIVATLMRNYKEKHGDRSNVERHITNQVNNIKTEFAVKRKKNKTFPRFIQYESEWYDQEIEYAEVKTYNKRKFENSSSERVTRSKKMESSSSLGQPSDLSLFDVDMDECYCESQSVEKTCNEIPEKSTPSSSTNRGPGRPLESYEEILKPAKKKRAKEVAKSCKNNTELLLLACISAAHSQGDDNLANLLRLFTDCDEEKIDDYLQWIKFKDQYQPIISMSHKEAVDFIGSNELSQTQYKKIYEEAKSRNCNMFPCPSSILPTRKECLPDNITVSDNCISAPIEDVALHTIKQMMEVQSDVIDQIFLDEQVDILFTTFDFAHGFDGSSDQKRYNLKSNTRINDGTFVATTLKYLAWRTDSGKIIYYNHTPGSVRYCRVVKLEFTKETPDYTRENNDQLIEGLKRIETVEFDYKDGKKVYVLKHIHFLQNPILLFSFGNL